MEGLCPPRLLFGGLSSVFFRTGTWGFAVLMFFSCGDAVNKISIYGVAVISNLTVCDVCVFHAGVFGEMKLLVGLWFLV